jgi:hypothetical protein
LRPSAIEAKEPRVLNAAYDRANSKEPLFNSAIDKIYISKIDLIAATRPHPRAIEVFLTNSHCLPAITLRKYIADLAALQAYFWRCQADNRETAEALIDGNWHPFRHRQLVASYRSGVNRPLARASAACAWSAKTEHCVRATARR